MNKDTTPTTQFQWITGLQCPACKMETSLFLGEANYITCSHDKCPNPDYADAIKAYGDKRELEGKIETLRFLLDTNRDGNFKKQIVEYLGLLLAEQKENQ